eukprot:m.12299 g.12299  ORF g.12299 m.12299 type:complete len:217 (+) comp4215_c0_seq2:188-838(+)
MLGGDQAVQMEGVEGLAQVGAGDASAAKGGLVIEQQQHNKRRRHDDDDDVDNEEEGDDRQPPEERQQQQHQQQEHQHAERQEEEEAEEGQDEVPHAAKRPGGLMEKQAGTKQLLLAPAPTGGATAASASSGPRTSQLPLSRIRGIMRMDPDINVVSQEAVVLITHAAELFLGYMAEQVHEATALGKRRTVQTKDVVTTIKEKEPLAFLEGVPGLCD